MEGMIQRRAVLGGIISASVLLAKPTSIFAARRSTEATPEVAYNPTIDPANFVTTIDNPYLPFTPGTLFILEGDKEGEKQRNEVLVTSDTKLILDISCVVVEDRVWVEEKLIESTLDWYAQDKDGNVWYMGEYSESYENGPTPDTAGSWEGGVDGALPGIVMQANPVKGDSYRQEYYAGEAEDMAQVIEVGTPFKVAYGSFDDTIVTREWSPLEPSVEEHKTYVKDIGFVYGISVKGEHETLELIDIQTGVSATPAA
jgi:hypothetical protein